MNRPLENLVVIEFTHAVMGPSAGMILADLGANVIRIEPIGGDPTRELKGMGAGYSAFYNRNKKSICIDLKNTQGKQIALDMATKADVVIENFAPGTMERLGLSYDVMRELNDQIIYCSLKGFLTGPFEKRLAMDEVVQMMGGLAYMTGPAGKPLRAGTSIIDIAGGMFGVIGILSAVNQRQLSGVGCHVQSSLFETTAFSMGQHMAAQALTGEPVPPMPERVSAWSIYQVFKTKDKGSLFIGIISDKQWERFVAKIDIPDLVKQPDLSTNKMRVAARPWLIPKLEDHIKSLNLSVITNICDEANVCFAPVSKPEDLFNNEHLNQSDGLLETNLNATTKSMMPNLPLAINGERVTLRRNPPSAGSDTDEVLKSFIGLSVEALNNLKKHGVIGKANVQE